MHSFSFSKVRLAGLASLLLIFSACSHLDSTSNTQVKFQLNMARSALSEMNGVMATVELKGGAATLGLMVVQILKEAGEIFFGLQKMVFHGFAGHEWFVLTSLGL